MKKHLPNSIAVFALAGLAAFGCGGGSGSATNEATQTPAPAASNEVAIEITDLGFVPARPVVKKGEAVTLVFTRKTEQTCAVDVMFPRLAKQVDLPMNEAVRVELPAGTVGDTLYFACSMNMITGMVVGE